jgi:hypothetical protein
MFRDEMSSQAKPSLDGLAQEVLAQGRRARRALRAKIASTALVAVGLVGAGIAVPTLAGGAHPAVADRGAAAKSASPARPGTQTAPVGGAHAVPAAAILTTVTAPDSYIPQPAGLKAPTSSAAILDELLKLLPPGTTSNYVFDGLGAETYFDGASGLGMIRLSLFKGSLSPDACSSAVPSDMTRTCGTLPGGATVLTTRISDNCIEPLVIDVDHGDGTVVEIDVATCLAWNGHSNPPTQLAITAAQALQIAANPAWGALQMESPRSFRGRTPSTGRRAGDRRAFGMGEGFFALGSLTAPALDEFRVLDPASEQEVPLRGYFDAPDVNRAAITSEIAAKLAQERG